MEKIIPVDVTSSSFLISRDVTITANENRPGPPSVLTPICKESLEFVNDNDYHYQ